MTLPEYFEFQLRTKIIFGNGTLQEVGKEVVKLGCSRAVIITDKVVGKLDGVDKIKKSLKDSEVDFAGMFDEVPVNSEIEACNKGYKLAQDRGSDILIAIGGGSVLDTAKGINILLTEGGNLLDDHQGTYLLQRPLKPLIAIPTTAGTASEVTFAAVIRDSTQKLKLSFISPFMAPNTAILDPEVTLSMPPKLTASTGMDALTHAIESIHSLNRNPISDGLAIYSIRQIMENLLEATHNGGNLAARGNMLLASLIAGIAFSNALVGVVHAMSHSVGGKCDVPHGIANSILLPYGMEYNLGCNARYQMVAQAMGVDIKNISEDEAEKRAVEKVRELTKSVGLPQKLSEVGVKEDDLPSIASDTISDGSIYNNPREATEEDVLEILKKAL